MKLVAFRFQERELQAWKKVAAVSNRTFTEFVRTAIIFYIKNQGRHGIVEHSELTDTVNRQEQLIVEMLKIHSTIMKNTAAIVSNTADISADVKEVKQNTSGVERALEALPKIVEMLKRIYQQQGGN